MSSPPFATAPDVNDGLLLEGVGKTYGRHRALVNVSLRFDPARVTAVLGPNGAGKSTLLGILSTLVTPSNGTVSWAGQSLSRASNLRTQIGYVAHEPGLYADLTAQENLELFCSLYGFPDVRTRAERLITRVGLGHVRRDATVRTYSRGMQQRLSLARALLANPLLLLFDEPGSALDPAGHAWLSTVIEDERQNGRMIVLVTHDLDAAAVVADHIVILRRGRIVFQTAWESPRDPGRLRALYQEKTSG